MPFNFKILEDFPDHRVNDVSGDIAIAFRNKKSSITEFNFRQSWAHIYFCPWLIHLLGYDHLDDKEGRHVNFGN
jgi:ssRNA-specific RNase YbeY (16S rRNA maturation enzyme)